MRVFLQRLRGLVSGDRRPNRIDAEIETHIELLVEEYCRQGMTPEAARSKALRTFGGIEQMKDVYRERRSLPFIETTIQDLRYGLHMLRRNPGFTAIAIMTLALGIGANTAIFSVVNSVLLKPLPYPEPEQLVMVYGNFILKGSQMRLSVPEFVDLRQQGASFIASGAFDNGSANLSPNEGGEPERVERGMMTPETFKALQVPPLLGRVFNADEAQDGRDHVIVLSHGFWQRRYAGNPDAIGQKLTIDGSSETIIGVMPPGFDFPGKTELWKPLTIPKSMYDQQRRGSRPLQVLARLKPGVRPAAAQTELDRLGAQLTAQYPQNYAADRRYRMIVAPLLEDYVGELKPALLLLGGAVGFVLLIACANVANLLLARAATRQQEMAVRLALGAGRARLVRQLVTESILLAVAGGVAGLALATGGLRLLLRVVPGSLPRLDSVSLDSRVLLFTLLASVATGVIFGLVPALQTARSDGTDALRESHRTGRGAHQQRLRNALVVVEIALALVLLAGAGLTLRSYWRLQQVDSGFRPDGVLTMRMLLPFTTYPQKAQRAAFFGQVLERLRAIPGVASAGAVSRIPMAPGNNSGTITGEGSAITPSDPQVETEMRWASPGYFQTMGIGLLNGRDFSGGDAEGTLSVAVVDENFARRFYPNQGSCRKKDQAWRSAEYKSLEDDHRSRAIGAQSKARCHIASAGLLSGAPGGRRNVQSVVCRPFEWDRSVGVGGKRASRHSGNRSESTRL